MEMNPFMKTVEKILGHVRNKEELMFEAAMEIKNDWAVFLKTPQGLQVQKTILTVNSLKTGKGVQASMASGQTGTCAGTSCTNGTSTNKTRTITVTF